MAKTRINLIPAELRPTFSQSLSSLPMEVIPIAVLVLFTLYAGTTYVKLQMEMKRDGKELATLTTENSSLDQQIDQLVNSNKREEAESDRYKALQDVLSRKGHWSDIFRELSNLTPEKVWLMSLTSGAGPNRTLTLRGHATSQALVALFFSRLEKSPAFSKAMMKSLEKEPKMQPPLFKFEFEIPFPDHVVKGES
jgi:Tfp pilus assembly protein PilN